MVFFFISIIKKFMFKYQIDRDGLNVLLRDEMHSRKNEGMTYSTG